MGSYHPWFASSAIGINISLLGWINSYQKIKESNKQTKQNKNTDPKFHLTSENQTPVKFHQLKKVLQIFTPKEEKFYKSNNSSSPSKCGPRYCIDSLLSIHFIQNHVINHFLSFQMFFHYFQVPSTFLSPSNLLELSPTPQA